LLIFADSNIIGQAFPLKLATIPIEGAHRGGGIFLRLATECLAGVTLIQAIVTAIRFKTPANIRLLDRKWEPNTG
jgi:hypothetical protein